MAIIGVVFNPNLSMSNHLAPKNCDEVLLWGLMVLLQEASGRCITFTVAPKFANIYIIIINYIISETLKHRFDIFETSKLSRAAGSPPTVLGQHI